MNILIVKAICVLVGMPLLALSLFITIGIIKETVKYLRK
nr:MAG TPA: hypothetical protein [Caudoviricetes sp.]DAM28545.1 MAG TPA: hypothetical protein [Caudoviricetes sp.]DAN04278.1 MAG TPA: hypothetical protein [Caudoviricetes sp.]